MDVQRAQRLSQEEKGQKTDDGTGAWLSSHPKPFGMLQETSD